MMFNLVRSVTFDLFRSLSSVYKGGMSLFLAVFVLEDTRSHVGSMNGGNVTSYIKTMVNKGLS